MAARQLAAAGIALVITAMPAGALAKVYADEVPAPVRNTVNTTEDRALDEVDAAEEFNNGLTRAVFADLGLDEDDAPRSCDPSEEGDCGDCGEGYGQVRVLTPDRDIVKVEEGTDGCE